MAGQPYLDLWEGDRAARPATHFQAHEGQETSQEEST